MGISNHILYQVNEIRCEESYINSVYKIKAHPVTCFAIPG